MNALELFALKTGKYGRVAQTIKNMRITKNLNRGFPRESLCSLISLRLLQVALKKVNYDRDQKLVWSSLDLGKDLNKLRDFFDDVVFRKLSYWEYEKEWRFMVIRPKERLFHMSSPVVSITFGLKCPLEEIDKVINIIRSHYISGAIKVYVMRRSQVGDLISEELELK